MPKVSDLKNMFELQDKLLRQYKKDVDDLLLALHNLAMNTDDDCPQTSRTRHLKEALKDAYDLLRTHEFLKERDHVH